MVIADCWPELGLQNDSLFFIVSLAFEKLVKKLFLKYWKLLVHVWTLKVMIQLRGKYRDDDKCQKSLGPWGVKGQRQWEGPELLHCSLREKRMQIRSCRFSCLKNNVVTCGL